MNQKNSNNSLKELPGKIPLRKLPKDVEEQYIVDQQAAWLEPLILEMSETSSLSQEEILKTSVFKIVATLQRKQDKEFGDALTAHVSFDASYNTSCVSSLKPITENLQFNCSLCFVHESFKNDESYKDSTEAVIGHKVYELYFLNKGDADLREALHEQVYLNYNFYPKQKLT